MTRIRLTTLVFLLLTSTTSPAWADDQAPPPPKPTLAVAAFETDRTGWMPPPGFGQTLAELLTDRLVASGVFRVIDAPRLVATASAAGRTDLDTLFSNAAAVHVDFVVVGSVTRLSLERHTSTHVGFLGVPVVGGLVRKHKTESAIGLTVRVINVHTGEVAAASMAERDAADQHTGGGGVVLAGVVPIIGGRSTSSTGARDRLLDAATQQAVRDVADQIAAAAPRLATYDRE